MIDPPAGELEALGGLLEILGGAWKIHGRTTAVLTLGRVASVELHLDPPEPRR